VDLLLLLTLLPLAGAVLCSVLPERLTGWHHRVAVTVSLVEILLTGMVVSQFNPAMAGPQLVSGFLWTIQAGDRSSLGVDGISLPLVGLTTLLFASAVRASASVRSPRSFHAWMLMLETAVLGVLLAQDWALFYACWELTLVPLFLLVGRWGGARRGEASLAFIQYTMGGSVFTLLALLGLMGTLSLRSTNMAALAQAAAGLPANIQVLAFIGLSCGFAVKLAVIPLHGWLPLAHVEASPTVSMLLSGVLVKLGAYGLLRAAITVPQGAAAVAPALAVLGVVGSVYGALLAWRQDDLKALIAYGTLCHMGGVLLSIATMNPIGWMGAVLTMVGHGLSAGLLFLLAGGLYHRAHTRSVAAFGGVLQIAPKLALLLALAFVGSTGLPGLAGFPGELHGLLGAVMRWPIAALISLLSALVWSATAVRAVDAIVLGPVKAGLEEVDDLHDYELQAAIPLAIGLVLLGLMPGMVTQINQATSTALVHVVAAAPDAGAGS